MPQCDNHFTEQTRLFQFEMAFQEGITKCHTLYDGPSRVQVHL